MATLEKIRSKSVLLFTVIIVALLAFILGDLFTSGRSLFGNGTIVAEIGDHKVDIQEYQQQLNIASQTEQQQGMQTPPELLQSQVLQSMLFESMMNEEINKLGITITPKELNFVISQNPQFAQDLDAIKNPGKYNIPADALAQLKSNLKNIEVQTENELKQNFYSYVFGELFSANELDAKEVYNAINSKHIVSFAAKELASLPDDKFQVSDDELKAEWEKNKGVYKLENEMRTISYITVSLDPSTDDTNKADNIVKTAFDSLSVTNGLEAIASNVNFNIKTKTYVPSQIRDISIKNFADSAKVGQVNMLPKAGNTYRMVKLLNSKMEMDSVNISFVQVVDTAAFDSVVNALNNGANAKSFIGQNNGKTDGADSVWIQLSDPNTDASLKAKLIKGVAGQKIVVDTVMGQQKLQAIYVVNKTTPAVKISEIAEISYESEPSQATITKLTNDLAKFLEQNNNTEAFIKNAPAAGYQVRTTRVDATTSLLDNMVPESRNVIKWAMNANKGEVSSQFSDTDNTRIIVAAVNDIYNDYIPYDNENVKKALTEIVRNNKKAESIINDFNSKGAKDFNSYVALTGDSIRSASISFTSSSVASLGNNESAFVGQVCAGQKGQLIKPFKTNNAVVVAQVNDITTEGRPYNFKEYSSHFNQMMGSRAMLNNLFRILKGNNKFKSNILEFYENSEN